MYCLLVAVLVSSAMHAQKTSLTVDCQTPGWLSSMINYGDQLTAENLKVTGYINSYDLKFIGEMMSKQSLRGCIDLENANIVGTSGIDDNVMPDNSFNIGWSADYPEGLHISHIRLPLSITASTNCFGSYIRVDTLEAGGKAMNVIEKGVFSFTDGRNSNTYIKYLILREGVDSIADYAFGKTSAIGAVTPQLRNISFPSTMRYIGKNSFYGCDSLFLSSIILPDSIETIHEKAFYTEKTASLDTIHLPKDLRYYAASAFKPKSGQVIYFSENIETIYNYRSTYNNSTNTYSYFEIWGGDAKNIEIHIKASNPPKIICESSIVALRNCIAYVLEGSKELYASATGWKNATIIEEIFVKGISLDCMNKMYVGEVQLAKALITPSDALNQKVVWKSSNITTLTISSEGKIIAIAPGEAIVKVFAEDGGYCDSVKVSVFEHTTGVELQEQLNIKVGEHTRLSAITIPMGISDGLVNWESDDEYIAIVDDKGIVYGVKQGSCIIKATSVDGGYTAECIVTVMMPVEQVQLTEHNINLNVGETKKLSATVLPTNADNKSLVWSSSNHEVVAVTENGEIEALMPGSTYVKVVSVDNPSAMDSCLITVTQPAIGITLNYVNYTFDAIGESLQLTATVSPENATNKSVKWVSSNESVCVVSNGLVVGVGEGTAVIIATTIDGGHMATCVITVKNKEYLLTYLVDGEVYHTESLPQGEKINLLDEPTKEGYTFSGWSEAPETMPAENTTISGTFSINHYTVTYIIDGEVYTTITLNYGEGITLPEVPEKEGYTFAWIDEVPETMPSRDIVINGSYVSTDISSTTTEDEILFIYTLDGQQINELQQGINIVRMKNGGIKKFLLIK